MRSADLYYRLNVFPIIVPALRQRIEDIPALVAFLVQQFAIRHRRAIPHVSDEVLHTLMYRSWPGNVRELQNVIERAVIATKDATLVLGSRADERPPDTVAPHRTLAEVEREHIVQTLRTTSWVIGGWNGAAARLGLSRTTLIAKMQRLGVTRDAKPRRRALARHHHDAPDGRRAAHAFLTRVAFNDG